MAEISMIKDTETENNLAIVKRVVSRYSERIVSDSNGSLIQGDIEKIKYITDNLINNYPFTQDVNNASLLEEKGYRVDFKHGSALSKINAYLNKVREADINTVVDLYVNESNIFVKELRELVRPKMEEIITSFNVAREKQFTSTGSNYKLKLINSVPLFEELDTKNQLNILGNGLVPTNLNLSFPLTNEIIQDENKVRELFKTGDEEIDKETEHFISTFTVEDLVLFWNKYMLDINIHNTNIQSLYTLHYRKIDSLKLFYLALTRIINGHVEFVNSKDMLENHIEDLKDILKNMISRFNKFINLFKPETVIVDYYTDDKITTIYAIENNYNTYLDEGGNINNIIGYVIKAKEENLPKFVKLPTLKEYGDLSSYYKKLIQLERISDHTHNVTRTSNLWKAYISKLISDFRNIEGKVIKFDLSDKEEEITKFINNIPSDKVLDTEGIMIDFITLVNSNVGDFIKDLNSFDSGTTSETSKEAMVYALVKRLTEMLLRDTYTTKIA